MLITSHLVVTLSLGAALSLGKPELFVALISGVGIDLDHILVNKKWIQDIKDIIKGKQPTRGINQHSWLQEVLVGGIVATLVGIIISNIWIEIRWWILPLFLFIHILMDAIMKFNHWPFVPFSKYKYSGWLTSGTKIELVLSTIGLLIYFFVIYN